MQVKEDLEIQGRRVLRNARVVLEHEIIEGDVTIEGGAIVSVDTGTSVSTASALHEDLAGDWLVPGLVELHTDHLETHYAPRPGVRWPGIAAIQAHDAQIACAGITTVFDCLRIGTDPDDDFAPGEMRALATLLKQAACEGRLRSEHRLHLRCEVSAPDALSEFETLVDDSDVGLVSLMDHAPGQRQFVSLEAAALHYKGNLGYDDARFERFVAERVARSQRNSDPQRSAIASLCRARGIALASHDDATIAHVDESEALGVRIAEFPTSMDAAHHSRDRQLAVLMGAPNVVRGRSHSGNVSARELAAVDCLDILSSDYVPASLLHAAFVLSLDLDLCPLPRAIAMVSANPARAVGLEDRGRIVVGLAADLVQVSAAADSAPVVRRVWRAGRRVA